MDNSDGIETKRKLFPKLHEKIQNKYLEMQKKLEKSKSIDSFASIDDEYICRGQTSLAKVNNFKDTDEIMDNARNVHRSNSVSTLNIVEEVNKQDVTLIDINYTEARISESECSSIANGKINELEIFGDPFGNDWSISSESLNEFDKKSDEIVVPSIPPPKVSMRNRIGSRIAAARERRREGKEKSLAMDKKKETRETGPKVEKFILSNSTKLDPKILYKRIKVATVTIALIEATGLENDASEDKLRTLNCRFKLGIEKWKSKPAKITEGRAKWQELFHMNMYDENNNMVEITVCDKDTLTGRVSFDISHMEKEKTHRMKMKLEGELQKAQIFFLLTISGTSNKDIVVDIQKYTDSQTELETVWYQLKKMQEVGWLSILVYGAKGLAANDCFCTLKLDNERRQTHTDFKTNDPNWMKAFTFKVTDVTSILEVIINDERKDEEVATISIPLLRIKNGRKAWYSLKDHTQRERARGNNPRILLEMRISWNLIKASVRVINPKEVDYLSVEDKFDRRLFSKNLARAKPVVTWTLDAFRVIKTCFEWESREWNTIALIAWLLFNWFFRAWMIPMLLLVPFACYRPKKYYFIHWRKYILPNKELDDMQEDSKHEKDEKLSLRKKISNLQDMIQTVQNFIGKTASLGESIKNLFNFSVPYLSFFTIFAILLIAFIMFLIPTQYIFMAWGVHKYTRKILRPNRVPNSEILDLLSRVPDDEVLLDCEELPLDSTTKDDDTG